MGCVSHVVKMHYWQTYRLAALLKIYWPPVWPPHSKKLAPPLVTVR